MPTADAPLPAPDRTPPDAGAPAPAAVLLPPSRVPQVPDAALAPHAPGVLYTPYGLQPWVPRARPWWRTWIGALLWALVPALGLGISVVWVRTRARPETFVLSDAAFSAFLHVASLLVALMAVAALWWAVASATGGGAGR